MRFLTSIASTASGNRSTDDDLNAKRPQYAFQMFHNVIFHLFLNLSCSFVIMVRRSEMVTVSGKLSFGFPFNNRRAEVKSFGNGIKFLRRFVLITSEKDYQRAP